LPDPSRRIYAEEIEGRTSKKKHGNKRNIDSPKIPRSAPERGIFLVHALSVIANAMPPLPAGEARLLLKNWFFSKERERSAAPFEKSSGRNFFLSSHGPLSAAQGKKSRYTPAFS
jgi:hypothetical protein